MGRHSANLPLDLQSAQRELPGIKEISSFLAADSDNSIWFIDKIEWIKSSWPVSLVKPNSFEIDLAASA